MAYFQDLPEEYQDKIFNGLKENPEELDTDLGDDYTDEELNEAVDDFINCHNNQEEVKEWVELYCL